MTEKQPEEVTEASALETLQRLATAFDCDIADVEATVLASKKDTDFRIFDLGRDVKRLTAERDSVLFTLSKLEMEVAILQGEREAAAQAQDKLATLEAPLQTAWPFVTAADWLVMQQTVLRLREALAACQDPGSDYHNARLTSAQQDTLNAQANMLKKETERCLNTPNIRDTYHALHEVRQSSWPHVSERDWYLTLQLCKKFSADVDAHRARISRLERRLADEAAPELQTKVAELKATMETMRESIDRKNERIGVLTDALKALDADAEELECITMPDITITYSASETKES